MILSASLVILSAAKDLQFAQDDDDLVQLRALGFLHLVRRRLLEERPEDAAHDAEHREVVARLHFDRAFRCVGRSSTTVDPRCATLDG